MTVDLKLEELKSELGAARDELDRWADKEISCLQSRKAKHEEEIIRSNGAVARPACRRIAESRSAGSHNGPVSQQSSTTSWTARGSSSSSQQISLNVRNVEYENRRCLRVAAQAFSSPSFSSLAGLEGESAELEALSEEAQQVRRGESSRL